MAHHQRDAPAPDGHADAMAVGQAQLMGTKPLERNGVGRRHGRAGPQARCRFVVDGHRIRRSSSGGQAFQWYPGYALTYHNLGKDGYGRHADATDVAG